MSVNHEDFPHLNHDRFADSAGRSWSGREFESNNWAEDDGSAPPALIAAIEAFKSGQASLAQVVDAIRENRLLVPLLAKLGDAGEGVHGQIVDKSADLAIVTVQTPDDQTGLPVFTSVAAMSRWNPLARPVPTDAIKVALAAASEQTNRVIIDAGSPTEIALRRPAIEAIAQSLPWAPPEEIVELHDLFSNAIASEPDVFGFALMSGDPTATLSGSELLALFRVRAGLDAQVIESTMHRIFEQLATSELFAKSVDSMAVKLVAAEN